MKKKASSIELLQMIADKIETHGKELSESQRKQMLGNFNKIIQYYQQTPPTREFVNQSLTQVILQHQLHEQRNLDLNLKAALMEEVIPIFYRHFHLNCQSA